MLEGPCLCAVLRPRASPPACSLPLPQLFPPDRLTHRMVARVPSRWHGGALGLGGDVVLQRLGLHVLPRRRRPPPLPDPHRCLPQGVTRSSKKMTNDKKHAFECATHLNASGFHCPRRFNSQRKMPRLGKIMTSNKFCNTLIICNESLFMCLIVIYKTNVFLVRPRTPVG